MASNKISSQKVTELLSKISLEKRFKESALSLHTLHSDPILKEESWNALIGSSQRMDDLTLDLLNIYHNVIVDCLGQNTEFAMDQLNTEHNNELKIKSSFNNETNTRIISRLSKWNQKYSQKKMMVASYDTAPNQELRHKIMGNICRIDKRMAKIFNELVELMSSIGVFADNHGRENIHQSNETIDNNNALDYYIQYPVDGNSAWVEYSTSVNSNENLVITKQEYDTLVAKIDILSRNHNLQLIEVVDELAQSKAHCERLQETLDHLPLESMWRQDWISKLKSSLITMDMANRSEYDQTLVKNLLHTLDEKSLPTKLSLSRQRKLSRENSISLTIARNTAIEEKETLKREYEGKISNLEAQIGLLKVSSEIKDGNSTQIQELQKNSKAHELELDDLKSTILNLQQSKLSNELQFQTELQNAHSTNCHLSNQLIQLQQQVVFWQEKFDTVIKDKALAEAKQHLAEESIEDITRENCALKERIRAHEFEMQKTHSIIPDYSSNESSNLGKALLDTQNQLHNANLEILHCKQKREAMLKTIQEFRLRLAELDSRQLCLVDQISRYKAQIDVKLETDFNELRLNQRILLESNQMALQQPLSQSNSTHNYSDDCFNCNALIKKLQVAEGNVRVLKKTLDELSNSSW